MTSGSNTSLTVKPLWNLQFQKVPFDLWRWGPGTQSLVGLQVCAEAVSFGTSGTIRASNGVLQNWIYNILFLLYFQDDLLEPSVEQAVRRSPSRRRRQDFSGLNASRQHVGAGERVSY